MTPALLHLLADAHVEAHSEKSSGAKRKPSKNPAADLAALGALDLT